MCLNYNKTPFDFTYYKVKLRTDRQSVGRSQISKYFAGEDICESFRGLRCDCAINLFEISLYRIRIRTSDLRVIEFGNNFTLR